MRFLFRLAVSTWKRICVNIQHKICMHEAVTQDLYLLLPSYFFSSLPPLPSLSLFFLFGGRGLLSKPTIKAAVAALPLHPEWLFLPYGILHGGQKDDDTVSAHSSREDQRFSVPPWGGSQSLQFQLQGTVHLSKGICSHVSNSLPHMVAHIT